MQTKKEREKPAPQQTQKLSLPRRQTATLKSECRRTVATERDDSGLRPMQVCGVGPEPERPGPPSMQGQATERALHDRAQNPKGLAHLLCRDRLQNVPFIRVT